MKNRSKLSGILVFCLLLTACARNVSGPEANPLKTAAKSLAELRASNHGVQDFAIKSYEQGLITKSEADAVVEVTLKISKLGLEANETLKQIVATDPTSINGALLIVDLIGAQLIQAQAHLGIANEDVRNRVMLTLQTMYLAVNVARVTIAATGDPQ